jgi:hypothetical protein
MRTALALLVLTALAAPAATQEVDRIPATPGSDETDARAAWAKLDTTMLSVDFQDTPLTACVQFVRQVSGINVVIDRRVAEQRALDETRITLEVNDVSLRTVLAFMCEFADLAARWRHSVLMLTSPELARGAPVARLYDVRDLTFTMKDFPGPEIRLSTSDSGAAGPLSLMTDEGEDQTPTRDQVIDLIQQMLPGAWDLPGVSIGTFGGAILVRQHPEIHRQIEVIIALIRGAR